MNKRRVRTAAVIVGCALLLSSLGGCSSNAGGATKCGDYLKMTSDQQTEVVAKMRKDHGESTSNAAVTVAKGMVWTYCSTVGSNDSRIDNIYHI